jgi:UDP-GlcNAc:undecaprenyl-phosphate GlcNAc-1-phosphate transferase
MGNLHVILKIVFGAITLSLTLLIYVKIALKKKIVTQIIRPKSKNRAVIGAGIIFPLSYFYSLLFFETFSVYTFSTVLILMVISFIDDIKPINILVRLIAQIICVSIILFFSWSNLLTSTSIVSIVVLLVLYISYINAFNFMDGINGMLSTHTIITISALIIITNISPYTNSWVLILQLFSALIFSIGNFRQKPIFISGDVGSIFLGFIIGYSILEFYLVERNPIIFLLMGVYLIDTGITMCINCINRENILKQHKEHLYEKLVFNKQISDLKVSAIYAIFQAVISIFVIGNIYYQKSSIIVLFASTICLVVIYIIFRRIMFRNEFRKTKN